MATQAKCLHGGGVVAITVQGLLEHVLRSDVGGVEKVGRASARDWRLRSLGKTR